MTEVGKLTAKIIVDDSEGERQLNAFEQKFRAADQRMSSGGGFKLGAGIGAGLGVASAAIDVALRAADEIGPRAAMSWEKGMGSAIKTIGIDKYDAGTGKLSAEYQSLNKDLLDLRGNLRGVGQEDIYGTASALGSLGIVKDQIKSTTETVLKDSAAFGMSSDDTASKLATINTLWAEQSEKMGGASEVFKKVGSAVNELGNQYSATESNVLSFLSEAGGTATVFDRSMQDTAAFGALLETVGIKGPEAATALRSAVNEGLFAASVDTSKVPKGYKLAADMLGISDAEMKNRLSNDLYGTLIDISTAVDKKFGADRTGKMEAFKDIFGSYGLQLGTKLAGKDATFEEMLGTSRKGFDEGTSAEKEYERQTDNLSGALDELYGSLDVARIEAWSSALEPAKGTVEALAAGVRAATPLIKELFDALWSGDSLGALDVIGQIKDAIVSELEQAGAEGIAALEGLNWNDVGYIVGSILGGTLSTVLSGGEWLVGALQGAINTASQQVTWENFFRGLDSFGEGLMSALGPSLNQLAIDAYNVWIGIEKAGAPAFATLKTGFQEVQAVGGIAWNTLVTGATNFAQGIISGPVNAVKVLLTAIAGLLDAAQKLTSVDWGNIFGKVGTGLEESAKTLAGDIESLPGKVVDALGELYPGKKVDVQGVSPSASVQVLWETPATPATPATPPGFEAPAAPATPMAPSSDFSGGKSSSGGSSGSSSSGSSPSGGSSSGHSADWYAANGYVTDDGVNWHRPGDTSTSQQATTVKENSDQTQQNTEAIEDNTEKWGDSTRDLIAAIDANTPKIDTSQYLLKDSNGKPYGLNTTFDWQAQYNKNLAEENARITGMELQNQINQAWLNAANSLGIAMDETIQQTLDRETTEQATDQLNELGDSIMGLIPAAAEAKAAVKDATESAQAQSNLNKELERGQDLLKLTAENTEDLCEAMSDFGIAQEQNWDKLGLGGKSYIGATGQQYLDFLESEAARGMYYPKTVHLGSDYKEQGLEEIEELRNEKVELPVTADTSQADTSIQTTKTTAEEGGRMPITADGSQAFSVIDSIRANAASGAVMPIYSYDAGGGGSSLDYGNMGLPNTPYIESEDSAFSFPSFASGDVFVPEPTLAIVGDRPGGEWIGGLDQARARFGGAEGQIIINNNPIINGSGLSEEQLSRILQQNNEDLMNRIWNAVQGGL